MVVATLGTASRLDTAHLVWLSVEDKASARAAPRRVGSLSTSHTEIAQRLENRSVQREHREVSLHVLDPDALEERGFPRRLLSQTL